MSRLRSLLFVTALTASCAAEVVVSNDGSMVLRSGAVEYRLQARDKTVYLASFGPAGRPLWKLPDKQASDIAGRVEGHSVTPEDLLLVSHEVRPAAPPAQELRLVLRHRGLPLEIEVVYGAWGETGVFTRRVTLANKGSRKLHVESMPGLALRMPPGEYELKYLWGAWGQERQLATERLGPGRRSFISNRGRSSSIYSPWFALRNEALGTTYAAQLAWSGNWQMSFEREPRLWNRPLAESPVDVALGMEFDFGGALALAPGTSFELPEVAFTATAGDMDAAANQLHRYQRRYVLARTPANVPPLVQFNSWYPFPGTLTVTEMKRCAGIAADLGAEVFVLDSGWYNKKDWSRELGDYEADRVAFPNGIEELSKHVRGRGMRFGIWVEIENVGVDSRMFREHPDWCLQYNGKPILKGVRAMLDFAKPEVRRWARGVMDRLVRDYELGWVKIDYNIDIGAEFDPPGVERTGDVLYRHLRSYYSWLDEVRAAYPRLIIENCSSGGLRFDLGIMRHTHATWLSDVVGPLPSVQLAYGCTVEFSPEVCNHWMVGDSEKPEVKLTNPPGWWDFLFRVPMNGQFGISSRVFDWSPELLARARENVALYKRIRQTIAGADVYHLTPPPDHDQPAGWMGLQYVPEDGARSVLMAYRLGKSEPRHTFQLRGLVPGRTYGARLDGKPLGKFTAGQLAGEGLVLSLDAEYRAAVVELE